MVGKIEISQSALRNNLNLFKSKLKSDLRIGAAVKGNAYGLGLAQIAKILDHEVDFFFVDDLPELQTLRTMSAKPALVLGYVANDEIENALRLNSTLTAYDSSHVIKINQIARQCNIKAKLHVKIDAYLGRQGVMEEELPTFLNVLDQLEAVTIDGVYAHFSMSDNVRHSKLQLAAWDSACKQFVARGYSGFHRHISGTGGIIMYETPNINTSLVRLGIGLYGLLPPPFMQTHSAIGSLLQMPLRWVSCIAQIKEVPRGYPIGYDAIFIAQTKMKIAVIPIGYSDGYSRKLSNNFKVLIRGKECPIIGRVSMNMMTVDISRVKDVKVEDEVVLLGSQQSKTISVYEMADALDTIPHEVIASISPLLSRVVAP